MNTKIALNLSRKWRSQNFDQIIGQDLAVRILKNSLYLGHYFPVYLFAGQRGCGKTSTARVFASALNCFKLLDFQKDPKKTSIPCLECVSCKAMKEGKHPDFIEIDAASYTGVDHMRNIIESSSLLPIMGNKRVYLIDEAHMLSKAAFNAALKILEEPPATALFILATTNPHKILETVRSRCFQLFFTPIAYPVLKKHLQDICVKETIMYDVEGLDIIVRHTQGSARDALNLLEQVRLSSSVAHKDAVLKLLGHMNDQHILHIIQVTLSGSIIQLLDCYNNLNIEQYAADVIWQRLMTVLRALIWIKHGIDPQGFIAVDAHFSQAAKAISLNDLHEMIEILYEYEELFLKTPMQHALLEMILLKLAQKNKKDFDNNEGNEGSIPSQIPVISAAVATSSDDESDDYAMKWQQFIEHIVQEPDPLLTSLFKQAQFLGFDALTKTISIEFAKDLVLFKEWLEKSHEIWQKILKIYFGNELEVLIQFSALSVDKTPKSIQQKPSFQPVIQSNSNNIKKEKIEISHYKKKIIPARRNEIVVDVSDEKKWKIASMLLRHFPGVVTEIRENS